MTTPIVVEGLKELRRALKAVAADAPKELGKMNQQVGQVVAEEARRRAPKGKHEGGGSYTPIAESIRVSRTSTAVVIAVGGPRTPYAAVYEFGGTIPRRGDGGVFRSHRRGGYNRQLNGRVTKVKAQPYIGPAIDAKRAAVQSMYLALLDTLVGRFEA